MGKEKGGFLTPKAIANRIKSKGLQKLRWYCQMCQKQCRDENGFKCHTTSESHQRQLLLFSDNPDQFIDTFSKEFDEGYCELLKRRFGSKRVNANVVYQEYVAWREHVHMNATQWETLTDYIKWLGREGKAKVDQTEKGWFVEYIDRDPDTIARQQALEKKEKNDMDDEERTAKFIQQQIERAQEKSGRVDESEFTELKRDNEEEKVVFNLAAGKPKEDTKEKKNTLKNPLTSGAKRKEDSRPSTSNGSSGHKRKSALDEIIEMEEKKKERKKEQNRKDYWLRTGIIIKITTKKLGEKYHKKKAVIKELVDNYTAIIKTVSGGDKLKVDQTHVETVIPAIGKSVLVVNGEYRGCGATLISLQEKTFSCTIKLKSGALSGRHVDGILYEDICKCTGED